MLAQGHTAPRRAPLCARRDIRQRRAVQLPRRRDDARVVRPACARGVGRAGDVPAVAFDALAPAGFRADASRRGDGLHRLPAGRGVCVCVRACARVTGEV